MDTPIPPVLCFHQIILFSVSLGRQELLGRYYLNCVPWRCFNLPTVHYTHEVSATFLPTSGEHVSFFPPKVASLLCVMYPLTSLEIFIFYTLSQLFPTSVPLLLSSQAIHIFISLPSLKESPVIPSNSSYLPPSLHGQVFCWSRSFTVFIHFRYMPTCLCC